MKRILASLLLAPSTLLAQSTGTLAAAPAPKDRPLTELPYTPSLDHALDGRSVDPCEDFYQYACGGWMRGTPFPPDQASWSVYGKLTDENAQYLWGILDRRREAASDRTPLQQKIGDYFAACMDETRDREAWARGRSSR